MGVKRLRLRTEHREKVGANQTYPLHKEVKQQPAPAKSKGLGDRVESALKSVGITEERVSRWLGRKCGCGERKAKLNRLGEWALKAIGMSKEDATKELNDICPEQHL